MQRVFTVTCPTSFSAVAANSIYGLISAVTGAKPTDGILPDRCCGLKAEVPAANTSTVTIDDFNGANTSGPASAATTKQTILDMAAPSARNTICLRDYFPVGGAASQSLILTINYA